MKVLYFTGGYSPHDQRFVQALAEAGLEVTYLSFFGSNNWTSEEKLPASVERIQGLSNSSKPSWLAFPGLAKKLRSILGNIQPDVIHAGPIHQGAFVTAIADEHPLVTMSWGSDLLVGARRGLPRQAARLTLSRSDAFVGDCQAVLDRAVELGMPEERIITFPWGVDLEQFTATDHSPLRKQLGWQDAFVLISTRAWEPLYGVDVIVKAFIIAAGQNDALRLLLLGGGSQRATLERTIQQVGVQDKIHLAGWVDEEVLPSYFHAGDLYLSASHSDGSSVSLLQALACGKPVLVSDIPGNREWVAQDENGWLFPDGDAERLADSILMLAGSHEMLQEAGKRGRIVAEQRANWHANFPNLLHAYELAIQQARGKSA